MTLAPNQLTRTLRDSLTCKVQIEPCLLTILIRDKKRLKLYVYNSPQSSKRFTSMRYFLGIYIHSKHIFHKDQYPTTLP